MNVTTPKSLPISVFIITKNEEAYIEKVLLSVASMNEVILVDSGSTDNTVNIAKKHGAKVYHQAWLGYARQKQFAMSLCSNEWVLNLDGDEVLNTAIIARFKKIVENNEADSVRFLRHDIFIGKVSSRFTKKANNLRLYKKSKAHFNENDLVHESATVDGKEIFINESFDHYGYGSVAVMTDKCNQYSSLKAQEKFLKGRPYSTLKLFLVFPVTFIKKYIVQGHIFSGNRGLITAMIASYYALIKEAKLYELHQLKKLNKNEK